MAISPAAFEYLRRIVREKSSIVLDETKSYLVELRLQPLLQDAQSKDIEALAEAVREDPHGPLAQRVVEAMATNETSFFRDPIAFDVLRRTILPQLIAARANERALRIWCGACSSGQEPYSIAMTLLEHFPELSSWRIELIASDLSHAMIERARAGVFSQFEVSRGLPSVLLLRHFEQQGSEWRIRERVRRMVQFRQHNLTQSSAMVPGFDVVFLRNVLIYFDLAAKRRTLGHVCDVLRPGGYVFLGATENTIRLDVGLERVESERAACYRVLATKAA